MNIQKLIDSLETEIELLERDVFYVTNNVSERALRSAIENRKVRIEDLKKKYLEVK